MSIIFDKIYLNGFLAIGEAEINLHEQGFTLVSGVNQESSVTQSNGAGKSAIFEGIMWTLTGETLRGSTDIINESMKSSGCLCIVEFHDDEHFYKVKRARGHVSLGNQVLFYEDGELLTDQIKMTQEKLKSLFPILSDPEILGSIILLGQGLPHKFSSLSPIRRKELLEVMTGSSSDIDKLALDLTSLDSAHSSELNKYNSENIRAEGLIQGRELSRQALEEQKQKYNNADKIQSEIVELEEQNRVLSAKVDENIKSKSELQKKSSEVSERLQELQEQESKYKSALSLIKGQINSILSGNCPTCGRPYEVTEESLELKSTLEGKVTQIEKLLSELTENITTVVADGRSYQIDINKVDLEIQSINSQLQDIQYKLQELHKGLETSAQLQTKIDEISQEITNLKVSVTDNEKLIIKEQEYLDCINYLKRIISREFKGYLLEEVITFLSKRSQYYGQYLFTNNKLIEVTLSGNKILLTIGGRLYENLSGGERQRVDLAVQFSLRDLLMITSGFSCNLLVLDEVFDNLDSQGSGALINLITSEFSGIDSVFIITHHSDIDIPYDNQITVVKGSNGVSELR